MQINDRTLTEIKTAIDNTTRGYLSEGRYSAKDCKDRLFELKNELTNETYKHEAKIKYLTSINEAGRSNAIAVATSKDYGLIEAATKDAIKNGNHSFVVLLSDLLDKSESLSSSQRFNIKRLRQESENLSGLTGVKDTYEQCKVISAELESYLENIGTMGAAEVRQKVNADRFTAEFAYEKRKITPLS